MGRQWRLVRLIELNSLPIDVSEIKQGATDCTEEQVALWNGDVLELNSAEAGEAIVAYLQGMGLGVESVVSLRFVLQVWSTNKWKTLCEIHPVGDTYGSTGDPLAGYRRNTSRGFGGPYR